jgi:uncharacterized protein with GYD domain
MTSIRALAASVGANTWGSRARPGSTGLIARAAAEVERAPDPRGGTPACCSCCIPRCGVRPCRANYSTEEMTMAKFLVKASYTAEGAKGVQSAGGTSRRDAVAKMAEGLGGSLESFYFAFGDTDAYVVLDLPDNRTAAAASIAVNTAGGASSEVVVLLTPEEIDSAANLSVDYRPPGG